MSLFYLSEKCDIGIFSRENVLFMYTHIPTTLRKRFGVVASTDDAKEFVALDAICDFCDVMHC